MTMLSLVLAVVAGVVETAGSPRLAIDGKPVAGTAVIPSQLAAPEESVETLKAYAATGIRLSSGVWTAAGSTNLMDHWWRAEGVYDWNLFDRKARGLLAASKDGVIFPRIKIDPPDAWLVAHPKEQNPYQDGKPMVRPDSVAWRTLYRDMLKDMVAHVEASDYADRVVGYHIGALSCGEWLIFPIPEDKAPASTWKDGRDPLPPPEHLAARRAFMDKFSGDIADAAIESGRYLRELTGGKKLVGGFFGYYSGPHEKIRRVIDSGVYDFIAAPLFYRKTREVGQSGLSQVYYPDSLRLHGIVLYEETDYRTFLSETRYVFPGIVRRRPLDQSVALIRRSIGRCLASGDENWWFLLAGNATYSAPQMMESIRIGAVVERETLASARWRPAEVAVFTSADELATGMAANSRAFREDCKSRLLKDVLPTCGVPYDAYELGDIVNPRLPDYKVYLFPNAFTLSEPMREAIKRRVRRAGKTAVWIYAPGYYRNGTGSAENVSDLIGMPIRETYPAEGPYSRRFDVVAGPFREQGGARSVFLPLPPDAETLRTVFREAGAHVWLETPDVLAAGRGFVMVHAAQGGVKRIRLPEARDVREIFGASPARSNASVIEERLETGETRVFELSRPQHPPEDLSQRRGDHALLSRPSASTRAPRSDASSCATAIRRTERPAN